MTTVNLNAAYFPAVELLSAARDRRDPALRRHARRSTATSTIGVLVAFIAALNNFFDPIQQLSQLYTTYQSGMAALDKIFELLDEEPDLVDAPGRGRAGRAARRDRASRTSTFALRAGDGTKPALRRHRPARAARPDGRAGRRDRRRQVDVRQARRALLRPDRRARARRRPRPARRRARARCARRWGSCPQEAFLFSGTIAREHRLRPPGRDRRRDRGRPRARSAPTTSSRRCRDGYDTEVGERGVQLSAGQRQLVAFARALIADPRILVLDEATSNVDIHTESRIEAGPAAPARRPHRDRHRPPPVDDPPGRPDRRARPRPDRRAGHARRAARGRGRLRGALPRLGRAGRGVIEEYAFRAATPDDAERHRRDHGRGLRDLPLVRARGLDAALRLRARPRAWWRLLGEDHVWYLRRRARRRARRPRRLPARRPDCPSRGSTIRGWCTSASSSSRAGTGARAWRTRLHAAAVDEARARGFTAMRLFTPGGQERARRFYEREGWSLVRPPAFDERIGLEIAEYRRAL